MQAHREYEIALHGQFAEYLKNRNKHLAPKVESLSDFFRQKRMAYESGVHSFEEDCNYIVEICQGIFERICLDKFSCEKV